MNVPGFPPSARPLSRFVLTATLWAGLFLCPTFALAQGLFLSDVELRHQAGNLVVAFSVSLEEPEMVRNLLLDGAALLLQCDAQLMGKRSYWLNKDVSEHRFVSGLKSDSLTREFLINLPGQERSLKDRKLVELVERAWGDLSMDLGPEDRLIPGETYEVDLAVTLKYADVPPWLKQTLFFWSWEVAPPSEFQLTFTHEAPPSEVE